MTLSDNHANIILIENPSPFHGKLSKNHLSTVLLCDTESFRLIEFFWDAESFFTLL
jgi:hypothetical protein